MVEPSTTAPCRVACGDQADACQRGCTHDDEIRALREELREAREEIADLRLRSGLPARMAPLPPPPVQPCSDPRGHFWVNLSDDGHSGASHCPRCKQWSTPTIITRG